VRDGSEFDRSIARFIASGWFESFLLGSVVMVMVALVAVSVCWICDATSYSGKLYFSALT